jgi:FAD/FMN-containing dehydrogenase
MLRTHPIVYPREQASALADDLRRRIRGEVRFDGGTRALYSTDASNYRQVPIGVVIPRDVDDIEATLAVCREHDAPILPRGCGASLAGQCCNVAVVMDCSKYVNQILGIDYERKRARVQPGCIFDSLRRTVEPHSLTVAFDTSTHDHATIGGMVGNNSCGVHSVLAQAQGAGSGRTADNVEELEILTYDGLRLRVGATSDEELQQIIRAGGRRGDIYGRMKALRDKYANLIRERYPKIPRRVSGYNLDDLLPENGFHVASALVGSEGTCITVLEATVHLLDNPPARALLVLGYPDIYTTGDHVPDVMAAGPVGLEALDDRLIENMRRKGLHVQETKLLPEGGGWLLAEFGGANEEEAAANAHRLMDALKGKHDAPQMKLLTAPEEQESVWKVRESGLGATAFVPGREDTWEGWEDSAVPPEKVGDYLRALRALFEHYGYHSVLYGHFGQGCIHCRISYDIRDEVGIRTWRRFLDDAADLVVSFGGSLSGEHGDGQARGELLPKMYGEEIVEAFREFKAIWDPNDHMNPGKLVNPYPITSNLRLGGSYHPGRLDTHFAYPDDGGSFARAALRCVGVGKCRHWSGGVMCPSFMVTHDEKDTTRPGARPVRDDPWRRPDRTGLAQRARQGDARPVPRLQGLQARLSRQCRHGDLQGRVHGALLQGSPAPALGVCDGADLLVVANRLVHARLGQLRAQGAGPQKRSFPPYARRTFRSWMEGDGAHAGSRGSVILLPDTSNNYFHPRVGAAAFEVLEAAGYEVQIPPRPLCCGRPLYAEGMLGRAKGLLRQIMDTLGPMTEDGTPVVGLEPACIATFKDELINLFPDDPRAKRLRSRARC